VTISRTALLLAAFSLLAGQVPLQAQEISFRVAAGAAVPVASAGERRDAGPAALISIENRFGPRWSLRLDGEWSRLGGTPAPVGQEHLSNYQDLRTVGASLNGVRSFSDGRFAPYLLAGLGAYRLQRVDAPASPYGTTAALQAGVGIDGNLRGRIGVFAETRAMLHLTDYGSDEATPTVYLPILIGLRISSHIRSRSWSEGHPQITRISQNRIREIRVICG
jgi:hypothetical protein